MKIMSKEEAINLLKFCGCSENLIKHCKAVSKKAVEIAKKISENGINVDINLVEIGGLLHDIGRSKTHGIMHGIEGAKILKDYPELARICERHIGAGITKEEAVALGLGNKDYIPETLEEKIIAHADNLISGDKEVPIEETVKKFDEKLGNGCVQGKRILELAKYIENLMKKI